MLSIAYAYRQRAVRLSRRGCEFERSFAFFVSRSKLCRSPFLQQSAPPAVVRQPIIAKVKLAAKKNT
jgi:hypothetical protein